MKALARSDRRHLVEFLRATENEIAIDLVAYRHANLAPNSGGYLPRPTRWISRAAATGPALRPLAASARWIWLHTRGIPLHAIQLISALLHHSGVADRLIEARSYGEYGLGLSIRASDIIGPPIRKVPACWIVVPWAPAAKLSEAMTSIDVFSLLKQQDVLRAFRLAVAATGAFRRRPERLVWVLQSYTAFRWFCVRLALDKLDGAFIMAEHYDRWAVLVDQMVRRKKFRKSDETARIRPRLSLVQHGIVGSLSATDHKETAVALGRRLESIDSIYVYDLESERVFKKYILSASNAAAVDIFYYQPRIALSPTESSSPFRILFVGHPLCIDLHVQILRTLQAGLDVKAYYKPHPANGTPSLALQQQWTVVRERAHFPEVDLLISYPSTLVREYAAHDIPAVVHPIDENVNVASRLANEVRAKVKARQRRN